MKTVRTASYIALAVALLHLFFGAIVRISGSGMGCGDHWPKCYGAWFPPLDRPDLVIEVSHRYLASILGLVVVALVVVAWRARGVAQEAGSRSPLASAVASLVGVLVAGGLGAYTVKLGNSTYATLAHWLVAMTVLALIATTALRAGGLGGERAAAGPRGSMKTVRAAFAAAAIAFLAVAMGGLTAKFPGAAVACPSFPLCGTRPDAIAGAAHVQLTHRILAFALLFHLLGMMLAMRRRALLESPVVRRAGTIAFAFVAAQILVAGAMIGMGLPATLRSAHQMIGVCIWLSTFVFAYLARRAVHA